MANVKVLTLIVGLMTCLSGYAIDTSDPQQVKEYMSHGRVHSSKLQKATGREKKKMAKDAMNGRTWYCMWHGYTQDCDLIARGQEDKCVDHGNNHYVCTP
jgi:hypothetical protein